MAVKYVLQKRKSIINLDKNIYKLTSLIENIKIIPLINKIENENDKDILTEEKQEVNKTSIIEEIICDLFGTKLKLVDLRSKVIHKNN